MKKTTKIAVRHWKFVLAWNKIILGIAVANIAFLPRVWISKSLLILPTSTNKVDADLDESNDLKTKEVGFSQQVNPLNVISSIATSDNVLKKVWEQDPQKTSYKQLSEYRGLFDVSPENDSTVISLSVEGSTPRLAKERAQNLIASLRERLQELRQDRVISQSEFIQDEVRQAHRKLMDAQKKLNKFKEAGNLISDEHDAQQTVITINALNKTRVEALAEAKAAQAQTRILSARLSLPPQTALKSLQTQGAETSLSIREKLSKVNTSLQEAQSYLTNNHPRIENLKFQQQELRKELQGEQISNNSVNPVGINPNITDRNIVQQLILAESQAEAMSSKAQQLQIQINYLREQLKKLPAKQGILMDLQRRYDITKKIYNSLVTQAEKVRLSAFDTYPSFQLLDEPFVNNEASNPNIQLIILGAVLISIFGSVAIILLRERHNPLISPKDIQQKNFPVLASIPYMKGLDAHMEEGINEKVEFQRLASAISLLHLENKSLMIASANSGEGKTTVTLGLANALIDLGFRILIVDADFRKCELTQSLGYYGQSIGDLKLRPINVFENVDLLALRVPEERIAEFVARGGFEQRLNTVKNFAQYDYILVDSPPVALTSEAAILGKIIHNILFVVRAGISSRNYFHDSVEQLKRYQAEVIGLTVNDVDSHNEKYIYSYNVNQQIQ
ncbi:P-loop NTPase [Mastigocoleus sp. MO_188.B34]|uniref:GumC family protein n=1 Tax=Mastigocoleus sp. MO_188.B34 TaxID=3036635 RepID=UPI002605DF49|nr:P-loop NTPase [Mastigocoleus sp. MO_188.B34]MDJ0696465.1 P-loop NTPase [Mastigocoleus sp. MO_188.B34]